MTEEKMKEWWDSLSDDMKWDNYKLLKEVNSCHADAVSEIAHHLLGDDYYTIASDWYGSTKETVDSIKYRYPNVNYSFKRQMKKIKKVIKEYFTNGK